MGNPTTRQDQPTSQQIDHRRRVATGNTMCDTSPSMSHVSSQRSAINVNTNDSVNEQVNTYSSIVSRQPTDSHLVVMSSSTSSTRSRNMDTVMDKNETMRTVP